MANEFYIRKGLSIATMSVATASGPTQNTKYLVLGDDSVVRWATASSAGESMTSGTSGTSGTTLMMQVNSFTSNSISLGQKTFNFSAKNLGWSIGTRVRVFYNGGNYMEGIVSNPVGFMGATYVDINIDYVSGSGTYPDLSGEPWSIFVTGDVGISGSQGTSGTSGTTGTSGTSGTSGINGSSGTSGANGSSGTSGTSFSGSGTNNYVVKWSGTTSLQDSNIQDAGYPNGVGVNYAPQSGKIFSIGNAVQPTTAYILNNYATSSTATALEISNVASGSGAKYGVTVYVPTGTNNYALKLEDGRQSAGYVLTSDASGNAYWAAAAGGSSLTSGNWRFDESTSINTVNPSTGGFAYWEETTISRTNQSNLTLVNRIQLTKSTLNGVDMDSWLKSLNGTGFTGTLNSVSHTYSKTLTKGYISIRNSSNVVHNFKVVAEGWYSSAVTPNDRPSGTSTFNSLTSTSNDPEYWLAVQDDNVNQLLSIYVDYMGSTYTSFSDSDDVVISKSETPPITVAQPALTFQISDGNSGLDAFGLAINGRNSLHLNNYTRSILGSTGSRDATVIGYNAGWTMSTATSSTFIGASAGAAIKTGPANTFVGAAAGMKAATASNNVFVGAYSGFNNFKDSNVFIGSNSGYNNNGNRNIFIGASAGSAAAAATVNNSIAIGFDATPTADNQLVLASSQYPLGTASAGVFSHYLNAKINGIDVKIPIYY